MLPEVRSHDIPDRNARLFMEKIKKYDTITISNIIKAASSIFKNDIALILLFGLIDVCLKISNSFILARVIKAIMESDKNKAYNNAAILVFTSFFATTFRHNAWKQGKKLSAYTFFFFINFISNSNINLFKFIGN